MTKSKKISLNSLIFSALLRIAKIPDTIAFKVLNWNAVNNKAEESLIPVALLCNYGLIWLMVALPPRCLR